LSKLTTFFRVNKNIDRKDYITLLILLIASIFISFIFANIPKIILKDKILFNIFDVIPLKEWLIMILVGILHITVIRSFLLLPFIKLKFDTMYFQEMSFHILKYAFISYPFLVPIIQVLGNKIVIEICGISSNFLLPYALLNALLFFLLWFIFLGTTIKGFLQNKYTKAISFFINIFTSFATTLIIGFGSLSYLPNMDNYAISFVQKTLSTLQTTGCISEEKAKWTLNEFVVMRNRALDSTYDFIQLPSYHQ
jgi:hypothetical protein